MTLSHQDAKNIMGKDVDLEHSAFLLHVYGRCVDGYVAADVVVIAVVTDDGPASITAR